MSPEAIIALVALGLNVVVALVGMTWGLGKIKDAIRNEIEQHREKFDQELDMIGRNFGETASALREKIREIELYCRDTFVRRESFSEVITKLSSDINLLATRIETRLVRMEEKIDNHKV